MSDLGGGSGDRIAEELGHRKHGRPYEGAGMPEGDIPQELARRVPRFGAGSRVPGWDEAADLTKGPQEMPDPATTAVPADLRAEIEAHMAKYPDRRSAALPCLAAAQKLHGWCSPEAIRQVAAVMQLTPGYLISVATFYDMFDTKPIGPHRVYVCTNISCSLNGGRQLFDAIAEEIGDDPDIDARHFECLGACDIAPMASIDNVYVGPIALDEVPELVEQIRTGRPPLPAKQISRRQSVDPNANSQSFPRVDEDPTSADRLPQTADASAAAPVRPPDSGIAGENPGDQPGPTAPLEQAPDPPEGPEPKS